MDNASIRPEDTVAGCALAVRPHAPDGRRPAIPLAAVIVALVAAARSGRRGSSGHYSHANFPNCLHAINETPRWQASRLPVSRRAAGARH